MLGRAGCVLLTSLSKELPSKGGGGEVSEKHLPEAALVIVVYSFPLESQQVLHKLSERLIWGLGGFLSSRGKVEVLFLILNVCAPLSLF